MGARGKLPGILGGILCAITFVAGSQFLAYFPRPILGGLLFFLGLDFFSDWIIAGWSRLSRTDYAVVVLILVVIATTNFLVGVGVGLVVMVTLFVVNYSRIHIVHHTLSGAEMHSSVERCAYHRRALAEHLGSRVYIMELQGFIFFGTSNILLEQIRTRLLDSNQPKINYLILDFCRVDGIDSSVAISFIKAKQFADAQGFTLVLTGLSPKMKILLEKERLFSDAKVKLFSDLDHGLEWCEEQLLDQERVTGLHTPVTLSAQLADNGFARANTKRLMEFLERKQFPAGEILIRQGEPANQLYFLEMGSVSIYLEVNQGPRVRLLTLGLGTAVGELGLYLGNKSTTSVITDTPVTAYRLTITALAEMKKKEPELAAEFNEFIARLLSERLAATTRTLEAVLR
jgi:sulfate permease, SulP family